MGKMREEIKAERQKREAKEYERIRKFNEKSSAREVKMELNRQKWETRMKPLKAALSKLFASIRKLFTFKGDIKTLIKRTKQVVGVLITLIVLFFAFFACRRNNLYINVFSRFLHQMLVCICNSCGNSCRWRTYICYCFIRRWMASECHQQIQKR